MQSSLSIINDACSEPAYKGVHSFIQTVLSFPATSAPIESIFSLAGKCTRDVKSNTKAELLNAKLLVHTNK